MCAKMGMGGRGSPVQSTYVGCKAIEGVRSEDVQACWGFELAKVGDTAQHIRPEHEVVAKGEPYGPCGKGMHCESIT